MACEKVYYYCGGHRLIVSDDFWDIVRIIKPEFSDVDARNVRARLLLGGSFITGETIIKGLSMLLPATRVEYDLESGSLEKHTYQYYRLSGEVTDMQEAVERMDKAMDATMRSIKEKYGDVVYGLGLSGGLDSRLTLHYALKNGMKVTCFNICKKRPHGILTARSVRLAQKLADLYHVPLELVEWDPRQVDKAREMLIKRYPDGPLPEGSMDIFKYVPGWKPSFDVMLTGGMGAGQIAFGSHFPNVEQDAAHAAKYIEDTMIYIVFVDTLERGINALFHTPMGTGTFRYPWEEKLFVQPRGDVHDRLLTEMNDLSADGRSFFEMLFNFRARHVVSYACKGAFESMYQAMPAFSVYSSYVLKEGLCCDANLLVDRGITRALIRAKLPEASQIAEEGQDAAPAKIDQFKFVRKVFALADRVLRGDGSHVWRVYWKSPEIWRCFEADMNAGGEWFKKIMGIDIDPAEVKKTRGKEMVSIWTAKCLLDALETRAYEHWGEEGSR